MSTLSCATGVDYSGRWVHYAVMAIDEGTKMLTITKQEAARRAEEVERLVPLAETQEERDSLLRLASDLWAKS